MSQRRAPYVSFALLSFALALLLGMVLVYRFVDAAARRRIDDRLADVEQFVVTALEREHAMGADARQAVDRVMATMQARTSRILIRLPRLGTTVDSRDASIAAGLSPLVLDWPEPVVLDSILANPPSSGRRLATVPTRQVPARALGRRLALGREELTILMMFSERERVTTMVELRGAWYWAAGVFLLALLVPWLLIRRGVNYIGELERQAREITAGTSGVRFTPPGGLGPVWDRLTSALNALLDKAHASDEEQRTFMAAAAHELRTPIAVISGEAQVALDQEDSDARALRVSLRLIRHESQALSRIVEELFLLARIRAREATIQPLPLYLDELLEETTRALQRVPNADDRVQLVVAPGNYDWRGDEALLARAITNLVLNALRHSPATAPVEVRLEEGKDEFCITVSDRGEGIPLADQPHVFDRFYRGGGGRRRGSEHGAGLGLAIARGVAQAHQGSLVLLQTGPEGSVFRITLPRHAFAASAPTPRVPEERLGDYSRAR